MAHHSLPPPPPLASLQNAADSAQAETWINTFKAQAIPKDLVEFSFSRSSGPGGQNVNKVNTKATLRCSLDATWIPQWAKAALKQSPAYVSSNRKIMITSTVYRSQAQNIQDCLLKLHNLILSTASASLIKEPSNEQKARVRNLQRVEKENRKAEKSYRSQVKRSRSSRDWD
ncbi:hypothetical protein IEO21_04341 [Rhodonia placenta]|uniref:Prokaryotic-type class I peptide chain release factors domain-containing protein n=1 Tax=Rhodonia placenta TaxID=104341 RepID=A0A8H7P4I0_9APHY|nr:hypothetical protein IEO21_04341 [Postia placenta]